MIELINHIEEVNVSIPIKTGFESEGLLFLGMHTLALEKNRRTEKIHYQTLPIGHTATHRVSFDSDGENFDFDEASRIWLAEPLRKAVTSNKKVEAKITSKQIGETKEVIILNCLDSCYGHCLDKLFNTQRHLEEHPNLGLIVIIHPSLRNLVPAGVVEIWEVEVDFNNLDYKIKGFDEFVKSQIKRFKKVYLSKAYMNLDYSKLNIEQFAKQKPFSIDEFDSKPIQITFILREDRFWLINRWNQFFYLASIKLKFFKHIRFVFINMQNRNIRRLASKVKNHVNDVKFVCVGLGKQGFLGNSIEDRREPLCEYMKNESSRIKIYSKSHIVIGVHGSHLLVPSAISASFISIHQDYKIEGFSEDFIPRHPNPQTQALLGRFVSDKNSPSVLAKHVKFMVNNLAQN